MSFLGRIIGIRDAAIERLYGVPNANYLRFELRDSMPRDEHWEIASPLAVHALNELDASELASADEFGFNVSWDCLYAVLSDPDRAAALEALALPAVGSLRPCLRSANTLADPDFEVGIDGWRSDLGRTDATKLGAIARTDAGLELLPKASFDLARAVEGFWLVEFRTPEFNREQWGRIRTLALQAKADLDQFLYHTVVITPERLQVRLLEADVSGTGVVEVQPWFVGAPDKWLDTFDLHSKVKDRYEITTPDGLIEIIVTPKVKTVLQAIKAMPARRTSGDAAERFLHNPFAALGPDAAVVLDEAQFDEARREAGVAFERFTARIRMAEKNLQDVGISVERLTEDSSTSTYERFNSPEDLRSFIARIESRMQVGVPTCSWRKHRLELNGDTVVELETLKAALIEWIKPFVTIRTADVLDLSRYSERIKGIGVQSKIVSPYIPISSGEDPWFPEPPSSTGSRVAVSVPLPGDRTLELILDGKVARTLTAAVNESIEKGNDLISIPGYPDAVPVAVAQAILDEIAGSFICYPPEPATSTKDAVAPNLPKQRRELLLKANIAEAEFAEQRALDLKAPDGLRPRIPSGLLPEFELKEHQKVGLAWMQNLFAKGPLECRGAVLADDMGLGKTLQLLSLICRAFEDNSNLAPVLIVAPVSLLENWQEEANRFFGRACPSILTLYGSKLDGLRAPRSAIAEDLLSDGIDRFLKPGWRDGARIVLTTYDTLRDLEFSIAREHWSLMICDEAQKIKNPAAMVTRAAKKPNVDFRIACTGTPVENSLTDLWCLFDFVQPGLLGALNEFGSTYRRPIECETEEQAAKVAQLRMLIDPQILRRTKKDVADLPPKVTVQEPRTLKLSSYQRDLYSQALEGFKLRHDPESGVPFKNHLGLLQHLRKICTAPSGANWRPESERLASYRKKSPKLDWLMHALQKIRKVEEKAIVFCEFRDVQNLLAYYIQQEFGLRPDIINGDTEAAASAANSRQKRIKKFQQSAGFNVLILSPVAVGFGVNIQAANHVIHFSRTWNPAKEDQATDRAYRIGQTKSVYVYYPVVCADEFTTFDVKLDLLLERKRALSDDMLNGCGDLKPGDFSGIVDVDQRVFDQRLTIDDALIMTPGSFEALVAAIWKKQGFRTVTRTPQSNDGGVDVMAKTVNVGELIQCKSSRVEGNRLGWDAIKDVVTGFAKYRSENPGVSFAKVAVTNQRFNDMAVHQARLNDVRLVDQERLADLLTKHPVYQRDLDQFL